MAEYVPKKGRRLPLGATERVCSKCLVMKPLELFQSSPRGPYHRQSACRECLKPGQNVRFRQRRQRVRLIVLGHYSNGTLRCACCQESHLEFLALDHIDGRASKAPRMSNSSTYFYSVLIRLGFPPGLRVLCHNCNSARGFYGYCPHETRVEARPSPNMF